jgi:uncharacterized membrane protein YdjX (TVP38/TMEM64 family)
MALLLALPAVTLTLTTDLGALLTLCLDWVQGLGPLGVAAFSVVYVTTVVLLVPATFMTLGAGATFGVPLGFPLAWGSAVAGATLSFLLGRTLVRGWVEHRLLTHPHLAALDRAVAQSGWKIVALSRLCPFFPFPLLNYAYGASRITLAQYVSATALGLIPGVLLYVWVGDALGDLVHLNVGQALGGVWQWVFYGFGLAVAALATFYITRLAQRALREQVNHSNGRARPENR